ncbi:MAG: chromosomal replication initiator protein DnaA [Akkermansia sp.]|nr:chromosomal replication initiator protein DnaA [Akkermansia sp.]
MEREEQLSRIWQDIVSDMKRMEGGESYGIPAYVEPLSLVEDTGSVLKLSYPADMLIDWVEMNYQDRIIFSATKVLGSPRRLEYVSEGTPAPAEAPAEQQQLAALPPVPASPPPAPAKKHRGTSRRKQNFVSGLSANMSFENFVVGSSNGFAVAAAKACAACMEQMPYNPLFIYGGPGQGKTHLLNAIGNAILAKNENARVLYLTSEVFANDYIDAISKGATAITEFRRKYRKADVLLIDDVQFLGRGSKTQEEFFHTFNALLGSGKQIVMTSDRPAGEIANLETRLSTRFQQGMTVSITAPDPEMRLAILKNVCRQWNSDLISDEVLKFVARNVSSSVRVLVGACVRLVTFASFSRRCPTVQEARQYIHDLLREQRSRDKVTVEDILEMIANEFDVRVAELKGKRRTANVVQPRQLAMYLARKHTSCSLQDIGAAIGGRSHGTVIAAAGKVEQGIKENPALAAMVEKLSAALA